jgi:hypothetical protein
MEHIGAVSTFGKEVCEKLVNVLRETCYSVMVIACWFSDSEVIVQNSYDVIVTSLSYWGYFDFSSPFPRTHGPPF